MHIQLHLYTGNNGDSKKIIVFFVIIMYMLLLNWLVLLQSYCNNMSNVYLLRYLSNHIFHIRSCFHLASPSMLQFWSNSDSEDLVCYREQTCCREAKAGAWKCLAELMNSFIPCLAHGIKGRSFLLILISKSGRVGQNWCCQREGSQRFIFLGWKFLAIVSYLKKKKVDKTHDAEGKPLLWGRSDVKIFLNFNKK